MRGQIIATEIQGLQVRPFYAPYQHRAVTQAYFERIHREFEEAAPLHAAVWQLKVAVTPQLCFHAMSHAGKPALGLILNFQNWPHRAVSVLPTDVNFRTLIPALQGKPGDTGRVGVFLNEKTNPKRFWFCTPGTDEYHSLYGDVEPFDRVRLSPEVHPLEVLMRCIRYIDISKTVELNDKIARGERI